MLVETGCRNLSPRVPGRFGTRCRPLLIETEARHGGAPTNEFASSYPVVIQHDPRVGMTPSVRDGLPRCSEAKWYPEIETRLGKHPRSRRAGRYVLGRITKLSDAMQVANERNPPLASSRMRQCGFSFGLTVIEVSQTGLTKLSVKTEYDERSCRKTGNDQ